MECAETQCSGLLLPDVCLAPSVETGSLSALESSFCKELFKKQTHKKEACQNAMDSAVSLSASVYARAQELSVVSRCDFYKVR